MLTKEDEKNMNIAVISDKCGFYGGIERYIFDTSSLLKKNHRIFGIFKEFENNSDKYKTVFTSFHMIESIESTLQFITDHNIETVIIHKINTELLTCLQKKCKIISVIHDHDYYCFRHHKYFLHNRKNCTYRQSLLRCSLCSLLLEKKGGSLSLINPFEKVKRLQLIKQSNAIVVLSQFMKESMIVNGVEQSKIAVIHPFIKEQPPMKKRRKNDRLQLLFSSQIIRGKGLDKLLYALKDLNANFSLTVVGKGSDKERCEVLSKELQLTDKVIFKGFSYAIENYYERADVVVFPSTWQEPFGLIGIEAFSYGKPVIAFNSGGVSEWLVDNYNGVLVENGNCNELKNRIEQLCNEPETVETLSENAYKSSLEYSTQKYRESMLKLLEQI